MLVKVYQHYYFFRKFKEITKSQHVKGSALSCEEGSHLSCENERIYVNPRHKGLGAKNNYKN